MPDAISLAGALELWPIDGTFNYLEVPFSVSESHKGRSVINFVSYDVAMRFVNTWNGKWVHQAQKQPLEIRLARIQGLRGLLQRFQGKDLQQLDSQGCLPLICNCTRRLNTQDVLAVLFDE